MSKATHRSWALPNRPWVMKMSWSKLLFAHWPVDPKLVQQQLPEGLQVDTWNQQAWIGVVPFLMSGVAARFCPPLPGLSRFPELNVRTYVSIDGKPGVWFFSLDATSRFSVRVARATFNLPYMDAKMKIETTNDGTIHYQSQRVHRNEPEAEFNASYRTKGDSFETEVGSFEHWLTARYCLYCANRKGSIFRGEIDHPPWQLTDADCEIESNSMGIPLGFDLTDTPHCLFANPVNVRAWIISRV